MTERPLVTNRTLRGRLRLLPMILAAALVLPRLGSTPGLHGDEAWVGLQAHGILHDGLRPILGMSPYTGPLLEYLAALSIKCLGPTIVALRLPGALLNILTVGLYGLPTAQVAGPQVGFWAACPLASWPGFVMYSRIATENFALNPFLAVASLLLLYRGYDLAPRALLRRSHNDPVDVIGGAST